MASRARHVVNQKNFYFPPSSSLQYITNRSVSTAKRFKGTMSSSFPKWPKPLIESNGDYCLIDKELISKTILKDRPLYQDQPTLPKLPVPTIQQTLERFIPTAFPLAENSMEIQTLLQACRDFSHQGGDILQARLLKRCHDWSEKNSSWLQEWWNQLGYLQLRDPVVVNISYFFQLEDDATIFLERYDRSISPQVKRGAAILSSLAEYRKMVCSGSLPMDSIRRRSKDSYEEHQLCSGAYPYMFHSCRIPHRSMDTYHIYDPSVYRHVIVSCKGQFYYMEFVDDDQNPLPISSLQRGLESILRLSKQDEKDNASLPLGILTSNDRDSWADARGELIRTGGLAMANALKELESGAILLCLDDETPTSLRQCANIYWTGGQSSGHNRWFDKSIQIIVTKNGKIGYVGEHSLMDGMPAVGLCRHLLRRSYQDFIQEETTISGDVHYSQDNNTQPSLGIIRNIFEKSISSLQANTKVHENITKATSHFRCLISKNQLDMQSFYGYGSDTIKKRFKFSPDAFVQMALQLATYRLFGKQVATYESSQVRFFSHGRTETTRTVSIKSNAFVSRMGLTPHQQSNHEARVEKLKLLSEAIDSHTNYLKNASRGHGVDRHLLGLQMLVEESDDTPTLFSHPLYLRSKHWRASTSTLPNKPGFGCVVSDGVGIAYDVQPNSIYFTITGRKENNWTERLSHLIEESLLEMRLLVETEMLTTSKL